MTIWEILIGVPVVLILVIIVFLTIIGFSTLIIGFPYLIMNFYKNHKNKDRVSFWEILSKTYF